MKEVFNSKLAVGLHGRADGFGRICAVVVVGVCLNLCRVAVVVLVAAAHQLPGPFGQQDKQETIDSTLTRISYSLQFYTQSM